MTAQLSDALNYAMQGIRPKFLKKKGEFSNFIRFIGTLTLFKFTFARPDYTEGVLSRHRSPLTLLILSCERASL